MTSQSILAVAVSYGEVRGKAKEYPYFQPTLYRARARKRDGIPTWRHIRHLGVARRSRNLAEKDARDFSEELNATLLPGIRHGSPVDQPQPFA
jgi:hypothetical protein